MKLILTFESYNYEPIFKKLDMFLSYKNRNMWLYDDENNPSFSIYVRKGRHPYKNNMYDFLDLASIDIIEEKQGQGIFTKFLGMLIDKYKDKNIYVESILNPAVRHICKKFGFVDVNSDNMALIRTEPIYKMKSYLNENKFYTKDVSYPDNKETEGFTEREINIIKEKFKHIFFYINNDSRMGSTKHELLYLHGLYGIELNIVKLEDDYYWVQCSVEKNSGSLEEERIDSISHNVYLADQFEGLIELIKDLIEINKIKNPTI